MVTRQFIRLPVTGRTSFTTKFACFVVRTTTNLSMGERQKRGSVARIFVQDFFCSSTTHTSSLYGMDAKEQLHTFIYIVLDQQVITK